MRGPLVLLMPLSLSFLKERGPVRQKAVACCPQGEWAAGSSAIQRACGHLFPLLSSPFECWERGLSHCCSHRGSRAEVCFWERNVSGGVLASLPWVLVHKRLRRATITALRRGSARPPGPRRGWLWHTTGADHWSCETLLQVSSSRCPVETECSPTRERNHPA